MAYFPTLLQSIGTKLVGEPKVPAAAADDVPGPGIIRQDDDSVAVRAANLAQRNSDKPTCFLPQPEGEAGSKRAVNDVAWLGLFR